MAERLLKYGLKDGRLVSIEDVFSGLGCGCKCPSCGAALIAKKGNIREHHFAHYGDLDCSTGSESALHLMAKRVLASRKELFVPGKSREECGRVQFFSCVELESREYPSIIPDAIMKNGTEILCVEILVTHAVDEEKLQKLVAAKIPTVEINLSVLIEDFDEETVTEVLLSGEHTKWIYNSEIERIRRWQQFTDDVCDYIPCVYNGNYKRWYECLYLKRNVSLYKRAAFSYGDEECEECQYYNEDSSPQPFHELPCLYRERELLKENIEDYRNIERLDGLIRSIDVCIDGKWQRWTGNAMSALAPGQSKEDAGKPLTELWKSEYSSMVVRNLIDKQEMIINGKEGKIFRDQKYRIVGRYSHIGYDGKYHYSQKYYVVRWAKKPIWELVIAFQRNSRIV